MFWCDQFTPTVNSPNSVGLNVCSTVLTQPTVSMSYLVAICGQPPVEPRIETPPERVSLPNWRRPYAWVFVAMFQSTRSTWSLRGQSCSVWKA